MSAVENAVADAKAGRAVFPLRPGDKRPGIFDWERRALKDPAAVAEHWPATATGHGVACGPSRLVVIDCDLPKAGDLPAPEPGLVDGRDGLALLAERAGAGVPVDTLIVSTPSGGWHYYFSAPTDSPVRNSARALGWCLDVRGSGGYVVGEGSTVDGRAYEVVHRAEPAALPGWLAALLGPSAEAPFAPPAQAVRGGSDRYATAVLRGEIKRVLAASAGTRNDTLNRAAFNIARKCSGLDRDAVEGVLIEAGRATGLGQLEARATVASGLRAGGAR